ncbi:golgin subfamily A member 6-like protein 22 [Folsomia candida]|uniref:Uncharacterized protein n=1 Tax=Folsomia candida TaxID=158441 RepID=A0A226ERV7_FOLCA|nr:golgin subfamily A member 6-like protein 22 [Folsomia candida]XP_021945388.1 golgin subfamily A member 6-like protein 22 [Folsomia candida]XP_021945389.1 golgin subfamily A member 6-like protein 22 [Folsomia candida]XP_035704183.1 golgin subfamily A member 6-like protein 22 [Folsomia candida]OXA59897.1 hypothetical protein Fcan01_04119 [Folsomia candida]
MNEENVNGGGDMAPVTEEQPNLVEEVVVEESVTLLDDLRREEVVPQQPEVVQPELAPLLLDWSGVVIPQPDAELLLKPEIIASLDVDLLPPPPPVASQEPVNWEERCALLERQLQRAAEATTLRKRLIEIRETESKSLTSKLKLLSEAISEEKRLRNDLLTRVEAAELECGTVKDKLRRNLEALERMKGHHERRVTMLSANLEIADIKAQGTARKLEESHRKGAEQKGLLEELTMKLNENKKVTKTMEKQVKKLSDKNAFLTSQVALIGQLLGDDNTTGDNPSTSTPSSPPVDEEGSLWKIKNIIRQSENAESRDDQVPSGSKKDEEDEGVELSSLLELENDDDSESEPVKDIPGEESCYKRVEGPTGPKFILSVSRTFIKLKDLILEKRSLQQQIDGLKNLNTKLESKTDKQEHRLYCVTKELNKTWHLVSKLKLQQDRLHNNEAFLRFELKENRAIVEKLKKEMQSYKEKWRKVREKNDESQCVWQQLKDEFAQRRQESLSRQGGQSSSSASSPISLSNSPSPPREDSSLSLEEVDDFCAGIDLGDAMTPPPTPSEDVTTTNVPADPEG